MVFKLAVLVRDYVQIPDPADELARIGRSEKTRLGPQQSDARQRGRQWEREKRESKAREEGMEGVEGVEYQTGGESGPFMLISQYLCGLLDRILRRLRILRERLV